MTNKIGKDVRVALITDLHWGVRNNSQFFLEQMENFYYNFFIPNCIENDIKTIWILGDVFDNRKQINVHIINRFCLFLETLQSNGFEVYCIAGNHDHYFKNTNSVCSLQPLMKPYSNIHLIDKYDVFEFDGISVGFISWIAPEIIDDCMNWINTVSASVLCGHFEINNFEISRGIVCHGGLSNETFARFDRVFSGHFHIRAQSGNIYYLGNPYQTNWGEAAYEKGFHIYTPKTDELVFVPNPVNAYETIQFTDKMKVADFDFNFYANKIVRMVVGSGMSKNKKKIEMIIDGLTDVAYSVELVDNREIFINDTGECMTDTREIIQKFVSEYAQEDSIDKKMLNDIIFDIYNEALEKGKNVC
jgi:DNA repair exonuclease SbcCD nuclease subunit